MKITRIVATPISIPLNRPHHMAIGTVERVDYVIVQTYTDKGIVGLGEAAAECGPIFSEESFGTIVHTIDHYLTPLIANENPMNLERILYNMNKNVRGNSYAKAAIEMSILDIIGKELNLPAYKLLGGLFIEKIPLSWSIALMDVKQEETVVHDLIDKGWEIFKIKVGRLPFEEELGRVQYIDDMMRKKKSKKGLSLRIDANQAWTIPEAKKFIRHLELLDIDFLEQPVHAKNIRGLSELKKLTKIPIAVDESLFSPSDALALVLESAADIFSIKILKAGGIINAKKISAIAEAAGIPCYLGGLCETGIGTAANVHLGVSTANITYGCEMTGPLFIKQDIIKESPAIKDGFIYPYEAPGLGITLDENKLSKFIITPKIEGSGSSDQ